MSNTVVFHLILTFGISVSYGLPISIQEGIVSVLIYIHIILSQIREHSREDKPDLYFCAELTRQHALEECIQPLRASIQSLS